MTRVRIAQPIPPADPVRLKRYRRGRGLRWLGQVLPVPWLRPWLRRRGLAQERFNADTEILSVEFHEWKGSPTYSTLEITMSVPQPWYWRTVSLWTRLCWNVGDFFEWLEIKGVW